MLGVTVLLLVAAAAALGAAAALPWARATFRVPLRGVVPVDVDGAALVPALGPLALLALGAVAATLATTGWARRVLGLLVVLAAVPVARGAVSVRDPGGVVEAATGQLPARAEPTGEIVVLAAGPALTGLGAVSLAIAGAALALAGRRMPGLGTRYRVPAARRAAPAGPADPERRWWDALDAGEDPTDPR
jgi:uncharacterized membrane protein (TIGR02234 family)